MDARSELLAYLGAALVTTAALFGLQIWYATYLDTHVVHVYPADAPLKREGRRRPRARNRPKLEGGKMPIAKAKAALAQRGRTAFPNIAPKPSDGSLGDVGLDAHARLQAVRAANAGCGSAERRRRGRGRADRGRARRGGGCRSDRGESSGRTDGRG